MTSDNHVICIPESFPQTQIQNDRRLLCFQISSAYNGGMRYENSVMIVTFNYLTNVPIDTSSSWGILNIKIATKEIHTFAPL